MKSKGVYKGCSYLNMEIGRYFNSSTLPNLKLAVGQCVKGLRKDNELCPGSSTLHREVCLCDSNNCNHGYIMRASREQPLFFFICFFFVFLFALNYTLI